MFSKIPLLEGRSRHVSGGVGWEEEERESERERGRVRNRLAKQAGISRICVCFGKTKQQNNRGAWEIDAMGSFLLEN